MSSSATDTTHPGSGEISKEFVEDRRAQLARLLEQQARQASFTLSFAQKRLWFLTEMLGPHPVYNIPLGYLLEGPLDVAALARSLTEVMSRHEILRTVFRDVGGGIRQVVRQPSVVEVPMVDLDRRPELLASLRNSHARVAFDLRNGPLLRPLLLRLGADRHVLLLTLHHIVFDGWSAGILLRELGDLYRAFRARQVSPLSELAIQYADFAHHQAQRLRSTVREELLSYWKEKLTAAPSDSILRSDHVRPPVSSYRGAHLGFEIPERTTTALEELSRRHSATLYMTLLAAFGALLDRYTAEDEVVVGTLVANRQVADIEPLIGFFTNTLVLRLDLSGNPSFGQLLERVKAVTHDAYAHQDLPFEVLVEELESERDLSRNPLFQVLFSYREGEEATLALPDIQARSIPGDTRTAKFDLSLSLSHLGSTLAGRLEYSTDLFDEATILRLQRQLECLLASLVDDPEARLCELSVLPPEELHTQLTVWNDTATEIPSEARIEELFALQAASNPDATALAWADGELSWRELDNRANQLAHRLRLEGVGPEVPVGICLDHSPDMVVALLAILKAGGAYLPLDPKYPKRRLQYSLDDAAAPLVLSVAERARNLGGAGQKIFALDLERQALAEECSDPLATVGSSAHAAYLIYTSGSTGQPKGVVVTHRNVVNFFTAMDPVVGEPPGIWMAVTTVSFDISVLELLYTLTRGFTVVLQEDPATLAERASARPAPARSIHFSLFYFGGAPGCPEEDNYRLLLEGARFADLHGFEAVWTPERHFHEFGGLFPNPAVTSAAVAAVTERVQIRAGSLVLPLHDPVRAAEDWSVIDNISRGRVGISLAPGWHPNDFSLAPDRFADRKQIMLEGLEQLRRLWGGETVRRTSGAGSEIEIGILPLPVQRPIPLWLTSARNPETFRIAGEVGAGILTHLVGHSLPEVAEKIAIYRRSWREHQGEGEGHVTLMLHTFVGEDEEEVHRLARGPLRDYLGTSFGLIQSLGITVGKKEDLESLPAAELEALLDHAVDRFAATAALLGTPESCMEMVGRLQAIDIDEVACLIDFGIDVERVLDSLEALDTLRRLSERRHEKPRRDVSVAALMQQYSVTHLQCTPSLAYLLTAEESTRERLRQLRKLFLGGEALPWPLATELDGLVGGELHNMYGPTETTIWSSTHSVTTAESPLRSRDVASAAGLAVSIGRPIANTRIFLVDSRLRPVPIGAVGELWIGGEGVARGYHGRPALTAERFVPDGWSGLSGARLYRTGDLARYRPDGEIEFRGRVDAQVKIRGHRIELGEVEAALCDCPDVGEAAVTVLASDGGDQQLIAYYTVGSSTGAELLDEGLRAQLSEKLPDVMVPSLFVQLESMPRTPNGKLDRRALPGPIASRPSRSFKPPESELERKITEIWTQVLGVDQVGREESFFEIGGNSFLIVQVRSRLLAALKRAPTLVELFRFPTVATLAAALEREGNGSQEATFESIHDNVAKKRDAIRRRGLRARRSTPT